MFRIASISKRAIPTRSISTSTSKFPTTTSSFRLTSQFPSPLLSLPFHRHLATSHKSSDPPSKDFQDLKHNATLEAKQVKDAITSKLMGAQNVTKPPESKSNSNNNDGINNNEIDTKIESKTTPIGTSPSNSSSTLPSDLSTLSALSLSKSVPREAWIWGSLGALPYLGTSITSVYLSHQAYLAGEGLAGGGDLELALSLLHHTEMVQISYGAVMLSFLGALHWGAEFSSYSGRKSHPRYLLGVIPVLVAWPTLLLPAHLALAAQWAAFTGIWWADVKVTGLGWMPKWYATYRFWLTFLVGSSILLTLGGSNYFGPQGIEAVASPVHRLREVREKQGVHRPEGGKVVGETKGDYTAKPGEDSYLVLRNVKQEKEEEEKEKKEQEKSVKEERAKELEKKAGEIENRQKSNSK